MFGGHSARRKSAEASVNGLNARKDGSVLTGWSRYVESSKESIDSRAGQPVEGRAWEDFCEDLRGIT